MIIFNFNVLSVNRFKQKEKHKTIVENHKFDFAISHPILQFDITYLHCGVTSIQYYLLISQQSIYSYNKIEYHIIINDNTKQFTLDSALGLIMGYRYQKVSSLVGVVKILKIIPYMGMAAICCRNSFNTFCQMIKSVLHIIIFCDYQSKFDLDAKKVQDQPKVTIWTYLVVFKFPKLHTKFKGQYDI